MKRIALILLLAAGAGFAQERSITPAARRDIDAGNQAWVDGMKDGKVAPIGDSYAPNGLDCGPTGDCEKGPAAVEESMKNRIAKLGHANSASVTSAGAVQEGNFVYEWGSAKAEFANGRKVEGRHLTVWQRQPDGKWKIFRNMSIPADR